MSAPAWHRAYDDLEREHGHEPLRVEGTLPPGLAGTLFRCGPACFGIGGVRDPHWFDGDGAVTAVCFRDASATGAVKLVRTPQLAREREAGRRLHPTYGARAGSLPIHVRTVLSGAPKNTANTNVLWWQGRLLALAEPSPPVEVDAHTLDTIGETDLGGAVVRSFSAHPHRVVARGVTYDFGVRYGMRTRLDLYALPDHGPARRLATLPLAGAPMVHDFAATQRHLIVFAPPLHLSLSALVFGRRAYVDSLVWRPEQGTQVLVIPIDAPERARSFFTDPFFAWHFANAYERGDEIVVDMVRYPDFAIDRWLREVFRRERPQTEARGRLERAVIDVEGERVRFDRLDGQTCEFPTVAPAVAGARHRSVYLAAHAPGDGPRPGPQDRLARVDVESGDSAQLDLGEGTYPGEPLFVARPGVSDHDDGWLLSLVYDGSRHRSGVAVVDTRDFEAGPVATAWFDHHVPPSFHGTWVGQRAPSP